MVSAGPSQYSESFGFQLDIADDSEYNISPTFVSAVDFPVSCKILCLLILHIYVGHSTANQYVI